jgi:hypothetical protein
LLGVGPYQNLVLANSESVIGYPLHEIVARFAGPALTTEQWEPARRTVSGPVLAPGPNEAKGGYWESEPVNSVAISGDYANPTNQPSAAWFACPNQCQLQFALADEQEAKEAARQIHAALAKPVPLVPGGRIPLFRVGEREAWLEVRPFRPVPRKLAFIPSGYSNAGLSPVPPLGTNRVDSAVVTIPPRAQVTLTGRIGGRIETNLFSTTLTNRLDQPGTYWLTWRPGSSSNAMADGCEVYIHDGRTARELGHFATHEPKGLKWRPDWGYESKAVDPGEKLDAFLLWINRENESANNKFPIYNLTVQMTMQPLNEKDQ